VTFKSEIVFVRILIPFIAGIVCAYLFASGDFIFSSLIATALLLFYLLILNLSYKKKKPIILKALLE